MTTLLPPQSRPTAVWAASAIFLLGTHAALAQGFQERRYATSGDWKVMAVNDANGFRYCAADRSPTAGRLDIALRIAKDQNNWAIGRHTGGSPKRVRLDIDGEWDDAQLQPISGDIHAFVSIPPRVEGFLRTKRTLTLTIDGEVYGYPLRGAGQAMRLVSECLQNRGVPRSAQAAPQAAPPPPQKQASTPPQQSAPSGSCPGGEKPLAVTGLCPADAAKAFLPKLKLKKAKQLFQGCHDWINETEIAGGDVVLYGAIRCKGWVAALEYEGGASSASLTSKTQDGSASDVTVTLINAEPNGMAAINRFSGEALSESLRKENKKSSHKCSARKANVSPGFIFAVDVKTAERLEKNEPMASINLCGPFGERDDPSHWRIFGGFAWHFSLTQDAESTVDSINIVLLERDGNAPKGWKIRK